MSITSRAALRRTSTDACSAGILTLDQAVDHVSKWVWAVELSIVGCRVDDHKHAGAKDAPVSVLSRDCTCISLGDPSTATLHNRARPQCHNIRDPFAILMTSANIHTSQLIMTMECPVELGVPCKEYLMARSRAYDALAYHRTTAS